MTGGPRSRAPLARLSFGRTRLERSAPTTICALVSGGLDSGLLLRRMLRSGRRVEPVYLRCGLWWEDTELYWLRRFLAAMRSPRLSSLRVAAMPLRSVYGAHWSLTGRGIPGARSSDAAVYLPGRNILLISAASVLCAQRGIRAIAIGTLKGNPFGDASPEVLEGLGVCLTRALRHPIQILTPLARSSKPEVIRSVEDIPWHLTFSCLDPRGRRHCGRCNKCAERSRAFIGAGVTDPTRYASRDLSLFASCRVMAKRDMSRTLR